MRRSMSDTSALRRASTLAAPFLVGAFVLASCGGGDEAGASRTTIDLNASSTAFVVKPPATTVAPDPTSVDLGPETVEGTQEYTVQSGDAPYVLTQRFEITLEDLLSVNDWASVGEFPWAGSVILLPPGARNVEIVMAELAARGSGSGDAATSTGTGETETATAATIPDAGDNCGPGTYTIQAGDFEGKVATKHDTTVEALRAANVNTQGYSIFYEGLKIVIPAKTNC